MSTKRESDTGEEERDSIPRKRERVSEEKEAVPEEKAVETGEKEKAIETGEEEKEAVPEENAIETGEEMEEAVPEEKAIETGDEMEEAVPEEKAIETGEEEDSITTGEEKVGKRERLPEEEDAMDRRAKEEEEKRKRSHQAWMHLVRSVQETLALVASSEDLLADIDFLYERCSSVANQIEANIRELGIAFAYNSMVTSDFIPWARMIDAACTKVTRLTALHLQTGNLVSLCASHLLLNHLDDPLWQSWSGLRAEVNSAADEALESMSWAAPNLEMHHSFVNHAQRGSFSAGPTTNLGLLQSAAVHLNRARDSVRRLSNVARRECMAAERLFREP